MKISVNGRDLFELSEIQQKVIKNDITEIDFEDDMSRRLQWVLMHKYEQCFERLQKEWLPKLAERGVKAPIDRDELAALIFSQPDYKNRSARDIEAEARFSKQ